MLDKVTALLDVWQQICIGMIQNADSFVDKEVGEHVLHSEGYIQDVRHLTVKMRRGILMLITRRKWQTHLTKKVLH